MKRKKLKHIWYLVKVKNEGGESNLYIYDTRDQFDPLVSMLFCVMDKNNYEINIMVKGDEGEDILERTVDITLDDYWHLRGSQTHLRKMLYRKFKEK